MVDSLATHYKVMYVSNKRPLEGLKLCTKTMWTRLEKTLKEETVGDITLLL